MNGNDQVLGGNIAKSMIVNVQAIDLFERSVPYRLPFRFGDVTNWEASQLFVRVRLEDSSGKQFVGWSAELMASRWFDKTVGKSRNENISDLAYSTQLAAQLYLKADPQSPFDYYIGSYDLHRARAAEKQLNPLVAGFGMAVIDRAIVDAYCQMSGVSFFEAVRTNMLGLHTNHPHLSDLGGFDLKAFLAQLEPVSQIAVRHTVGYLDPIEGSEDDTLDLQTIISKQKLQYFKIKLSGEIDADLNRLKLLAACLDVSCPQGYQVTLDGNEQFASVSVLQDLLERVKATKGLEQFWKALIFIEQPLDRSITFSEHLPDSIGKPLIIDEADDSLDAFPRAYAAGYRGVSIKSCKGIYKAILNAARAAKYGSNVFISAEDLTMQPGIAVQQDLAVTTLLGLSHGERNGHHFAEGFAGAPAEEANAFLAAHPDLYGRENGHVRLKIKNGMLSTESLALPGFAHGAEPRLESLKPL